MLLLKLLKNTKINELIKIHGPSEKIIDFKPNHILWKSLIDIKSNFQKRGIEYIIVLQPIHPNMKNYSILFYEKLAEFISSNDELTIYNWSQLLSKEDFIDHIHTNEKGRDKLTKELKKIIN